MALSATQVEKADRKDGNDFVALMARVGEQDRGAFERVFAHFGPRVKAMMLKSGADQALAEDIVQDVFLTVWRKSGLYVSERGTVGAWIFTIARNARIDRLRRQSVQPYDDVNDLEIAADGDDAEQQLDLAQRAERVTSAITELPEEQRQIIELAYMHDLAQSEIATRLSLPLGTVKSRMRLAYAKLKQRLEDTR